MSKKHPAPKATRKAAQKAAPAARKAAPKAARKLRPARSARARTAAPAVAKPSPPAAEPSLYERLGGVYAIAAVVDDFVDRVMQDSRLNANPKVDEAHHRVPPAGFKYLVTEQVCSATGGPQKYTGRTMRDSHVQLDITSAEWDAFLDDFQQTLDRFGVPQAERAELFAIVESTRGDIVRA